MTERNDWVAFLNRFGVHWETLPENSGDKLPDNTIIIPSYGGDHNDGYLWFKAIIEFDADDNFIKIGIWE